MKNYLFILFGLLAFISLQANNLEISNVQYDDNTNLLSFDIQWENRWFLSTDSYDGAWVFAKYAPNGGNTWLHVPFQDSIAQQDIFQFVSHNDKGLMIGSLILGTGNFGPYTIEIETEELIGDFQHFKVFGVECVWSPEGDFYAGDATSEGRFYMNGSINTPFLIESEDPIMRGSSMGEFDQDNSANSSNLNAEYPKGYASFFCMKYKVTAKQYVDFLNCLSRSQQDARTKTPLGQNVTNRYVMTQTPNVVDRNPIKCKANLGTGPVTFYLDLDDDNIPNEPEDGASIAINHLTVQDMLAYLDWIALRPMSELEYEKLCRGKLMPPLPNEFAWGTDTYNTAGALTNPGTASESVANVGIDAAIYSSEPLRVGFAATASSDRVEASATFNGILDMHNLAEFMLGVESTNLTLGSTGDGLLNLIGSVNESDWLSGQFLTTYNTVLPIPNSISAEKANLGIGQRSAFIGFRGVIKLYPNL